MQSSRAMGNIVDTTSEHMSAERNMIISEEVEFFYDSPVDELWHMIRG